MLRAAPPSTLSVISEGELAATVPLSLVPSRITTVACGRAAGSCLAQDAKNSTGKKPDRIGYAQGGVLSVHQGQQGILPIARGDGHVFAQPESVELIHPIVVAGFGAA